MPARTKGVFQRQEGKMRHTKNGISRKAAAIAAVLAAAIIAALVIPGAGRQPFFFGLTGGAKAGNLAVSLTFDVEDVDDANETASIPAILDLLGRRNITATFFVTGRFAERYPDLVRRIHGAGHEIGLHTYEHFFPVFTEAHASKVAKAFGTSQAYVWMMSFRTPAAFEQSIRKNQRAIINATGGYFPKSFRSPGLVTRWDPSDAFYEALEYAGVWTDSSVMQDFSSAGTVLAPVHIRGAVTEVPVARGEDFLGAASASPAGRALTERLRMGNIPLVIMLHPKNMGDEELSGLGGLISGLEGRYNVTFLTIASLAAQTAAR